jgi:ABC-2 type transport system ATP-binding protein
VDDVSFTIPVGQVVGLAGANGAGKSTTLKAILGLVRPLAGTCRLFGQPGRVPAARQAVGYLPETSCFPHYLTGRELVEGAARLHGVPRSERRERADQAVAHVGMTAHASRRLNTYSHGMLRRIGLAQVLVHDPALVILDEPTAGLDPDGVALLGGVIGNLKRQGKTVLLTSHVFGGLENECDRILLLDRGRLVLDEPVAALTAQPGRMMVQTDVLAAAELEALQTWMTERGHTVFAAGPARVPLETVLPEQIRLSGSAFRT